MARIFIILLVLTSSLLMADVKSTTGQIKFDTQMDNQAEMTLNETGLGIGVTPSTNLHVHGNAIVSEQVFIGGSSGSSNLNVNGTFGFGIQTVSSNVTLGDYSVVLVNSSSDNIKLTLPYAGNVTNRIYSIKKTSISNSVCIHGNGNKIDDSPFYLLTSGNISSIEVASDGSQWFIMSSTTGTTNGWTPDQLSTECWFDAFDTSTITLISGNVSQWNDKSGNDRHASQGSETNRPVYNASGLNTRGVITFDGSNDSLSLTGSSFLSRSIFAVFNANDGASFSGFNWVFGSSTITKVPAIFGNAIFGNGTTIYSSLPQQGAADNTKYVDGIVSGDFSPLLEHKLFGAIANSDSASRSDWVIGNGDGPWNGDIVELIVLSSVISTMDRQKLEGYLAWKWGLESRLDSSHPYKNSPPE